MSFVSRRSSFSHAGNGVEALTNKQIMSLTPLCLRVGEAREPERPLHLHPDKRGHGRPAHQRLHSRVRQAGRSRVPGKANFTKHLIRFRHAGQANGLRKVGDTFPEVVLVNSHDGTSAYKVMAGLFRLIYLNGMVVSDREFANISIPTRVMSPTW